MVYSFSNFTIKRLARIATILLIVVFFQGNAFGQVSFSIQDITTVQHCDFAEFEITYNSDGSVHQGLKDLVCKDKFGNIIACPFDPDDVEKGFDSEFTITVYKNFTPQLTNGDEVHIIPLDDNDQELEAFSTQLIWDTIYDPLPAPVFSQTEFFSCAGEVITISAVNLSENLIWSTNRNFSTDVLDVPNNTLNKVVSASDDYSIYVSQVTPTCQGTQFATEIKIKGYSTPALSIDAGQVPQNDFCSTANLDVLMTSHIASYVEWSVDSSVAAVFNSMPTSGIVDEEGNGKFRFDKTFQLRPESMTHPYTSVPQEVTFTFTPYNSEHCAGSTREFTITVNPVLQLLPEICYEVDYVGDSRRFTLTQDPQTIGLLWESSNSDMGGPYQPYTDNTTFMTITQDTWFRAKIDQNIHSCATTANTNTVKIIPDGISNCDGTEGPWQGGGENNSCDIFLDNPFEIDLLRQGDGHEPFEFKIESHNGEFELTDISVSISGDTAAVTGESTVVQQIGNEFFVSHSLTNTASSSAALTYTVTVVEKHGCDTTQEAVNIEVPPSSICQDPFGISSVSPLQISICSGDTISFDVSTIGQTDLNNVALNIPNTNIGRGHLVTTGNDSVWSISEVLINNTLSDITTTAILVVPGINGCATPTESIQITVKPQNSTGELLFNDETEPPAFFSTDGMQTISLSMDEGHVGAPVEIKVLPEGSSTWQTKGQISVGGSLNVDFIGTSSVKAVSTSTSSCISQSESAVEVISFSATAAWANGFPDNYTICSSADVDHNITSNIPGVQINWVRTVEYGVITDGGANPSNYISGTLGANGRLWQVLSNFETSDAKVKYTITQIHNGQEVLSDEFEVIVHSYEENSQIGIANTSPKSICGATSGMVKLAGIHTGPYHWERLDLLTYDQYSSNIENAPWQLIATPSDSQYVAENTVFRVVADGNCVLGPDTQETTVHVVTNPPPMISNKADMSDDIDISICTGESFNQPILLSNNFGVYDWFASVVQGSIQIDHWTDMQGLNRRSNNLVDALINTGSTDAIVEYKIYSRIHGCYGDTAVVKVKVSPTITTGQLTASTTMLCSADSVTITHANAIGSRFLWSKWTPSLGWKDLGTDWSTKNFFVDETAVFKVEAYGDCLDSQDVVAYSDTIHYVSPTYLSEADIYIEQNLACDTTIVKKVGDDWTSWFWQPTDSSYSEVDNNELKVMTSGIQLFLRKKVLDCWGPIKTINVSYLDQPTTLASDIHRFGEGKAALRATPSPGLSYKWSGTGGFVEESESVVFKEVPLGETNFNVEAISPEACSSAVPVQVKVTAHPVPRSAMSGPQFLSSSEPTSILLNQSYSDIKWYKDGELLSGETNTSLSVVEAGAYWARITLPDGTAMNTAPTRVMKWSNDKLTSPPAGDPQPPMSSLTTGEDLTSMNYTRVLVARTAEADESQVTIGSPLDDVAVVTAHTDGLGRQIQSVARGSSFSGKDQISIANYDALGRSTRQYMSYTAGTSDGSFQGDPFADQSDFYDSPSTGIAATMRPYSEVLYDNSPLNRIVETAMPGDAWNPGSSWSDPERKTTTYNQRSNHSKRDGDIERYFLDGVMLDSYGTYANHTLRVSETLNPMKQVVQTFANRRGQTILRRVKGENDLWADTYYVYDDLDQLVLILTPEAVRIIGTPDYANSTGIAIIQTDTTFSAEPEESYVYNEGSALKVVSVCIIAIPVLLA
ncbi:MAG: DUF6443 domain-containing protein [Cyclobacteriaceae bacterium]